MPFDHVFLVRFGGDVYLRTLLKGYVLAVLILQSVFDPNFPIELLGALNGDLPLFQFVRISLLDDLIDRSG